MVPLSPGIYQYFVEQDNGDGATALGEYASRFFVIPGTPEIEGTASGNRVELSGSFPLELSSSLVLPTECESSDVDYDAGTWDCTTYPLPPGHHVFTVLAIADEYPDSYGVGEGEVSPEYDAAGQSAQASTTVTVGLPLVEYGEFAPGGVTITGTPRDPAGSVEIGIDEYYSGESYFTEFCSGPDYDDVGYGDPTVCSLDYLDYGTYYSYAQQDDGEGEFPDFFRYDYFTVPEAPEIAWFTHNSDGTVTFHGYASNTFEITIITGDAQHVVPCEVAFVDEEWDFSWSCTTTGIFEVGDYSFGAYATDAAGDELGRNSDLDDSGMVYHAGGMSPISYPGLPVVAYHPVPDGIYVDAYATGLATKVRVDLFSFDGDDEGWQDNCGGISLPDFDDSEYYEDVSIFDGISGDPGHNFGCPFERLSEFSDSNVWAIKSQQDGGEYPDSTYDYFYLPDAPVI
ncbi:MAG: hypothetical protein Q8M65_11260, partial [Rhodoglobus sp.]|nr:hypothetical protein [Rhodoglobus sp.]